MCESVILYEAGLRLGMPVVKVPNVVDSNPLAIVTSAKAPFRDSGCSR